MTRVFFIVLLLVLVVVPARADDIPRLISYQGLLSESGTGPVDGSRVVIFRLYEAVDATSSVWGEAQLVECTEGRFSVELGATEELSIDFDRAYWLGIQVNGDVEMTPRLPLMPAPYALNAVAISDSVVTPTKVADGTAVRSLNGLTESLQIVGGANVTVSSSGSTITISSTGSGGGGDADWVLSGSNMYAGVDGNVGIGTTSPARKLHLQSNEDSAGMAMKTTGSWSLLLEQSDNSDFSITNGGQKRVFMPANGNVGIGTLAPSARLDVAGPNDPQLVVDSTDLNGDDAGIVVRGSRNATTTGDVSYVDLRNFDDDEGASGTEFSMARISGGMDAVSGQVGWLRFQTNTGAQLQEAMRVTSQGRIGIGTTSPSALLEVNGTTEISGPNGGLIQLKTPSDATSIVIDGSEGSLGGIINMFNDDDVRSVEIDGHEGPGDGVIRVFDATGVKTVELNGDQGTSGNVAIFNEQGTRTIALDAREGDLAGQILLFDANGDQTIEIDADRGGTSRLTIDVIELTGGADLSENFDVSFADPVEAGAPKPGMVVRIDPSRPGELVVADRAFDTRVAGVISGAGGVRPGMLMSQRGSAADGEHPVALTGRVYVWADASSGPIVPGDLLTTSDVPGHAMRVEQPARASGSVLGKAMTSLESGRGLILVLVSLQ